MKPVAQTLLPLLRPPAPQHLPAVPPQELPWIGYEAAMPWIRWSPAARSIVEERR
jgi:hypothetical protein